MKLAIIGATGLLGAPSVAEAAGRGHEVTAICRHPEQVFEHPMVRAVACDVFETAQLSDVLRGHDAVVHSYSPRRDYTVNRKEPHARATESIIAAVKAAGVGRLLAVGGAGTLEVAPGVRLMDTPAFPPDYMESAISTAEILYRLREETALDWTFLSPSTWLEDCGRTGKFRLGEEQLLVDANGRSGISYEDYAVALIDEFETPRHNHRRFTVGY